MMGMHPVAFVGSWVITYLVIYFVVSVVTARLLVAGGILPHSSGTLVFCWLFVFAIASVSYAMVITTLFDKALLTIWESWPCHEHVQGPSLTPRSCRVQSCSVCLHELQQRRFCTLGSEVHEDERTFVAVLLTRRMVPNSGTVDLRMLLWSQGRRGRTREGWRCTSLLVCSSFSFVWKLRCCMSSKWQLSLDVVGEAAEWQ